MESRPGQANWRSLQSGLLLAALTLACLVPFCGKAFHVDDPLFIWAAQHIAQHPLDPYGFSLVWYSSSMQMSEVTMNPPLASYYIAVIGQTLGWSEPVLHLAFIPPALVVVLGTCHLARRFTRYPLLAACATLLAPGFLVSSTNVMCDTMMLAFWILAMICWLNGLDKDNPVLLALSGVLITLCALTKYFGIAMIPLLLVYSLIRKRRAGSWIAFLLIPVLALAVYQHWTTLLYGKGLLAQAAEYSSDDTSPRQFQFVRVIMGFSFAGGCALPALTFIPLIWSRRRIFAGALIAIAAGFGCAFGPVMVPGDAPEWNLALQMSLFIAGGISLLALAVADWTRRRNADSTLLLLWILGTFCFAVFVNWTVNARSLLPLIPAAGILLARRADRNGVSSSWSLRKLTLPLVASGIIALWVTTADTTLANSARTAAQYVYRHSEGQPANISFEGHWGFQYYMQRLGFRPVDFDSYRIEPGRMIVMPENNTNLQRIPQQFVGSQTSFSRGVNVGAITICAPMGAGFYAADFGPVPFAFGPVPPERYVLYRLTGSGSF